MPSRVSLVEPRPSISTPATTIAYAKSQVLIYVNLFSKKLAKVRAFIPKSIESDIKSFNDIEFNPNELLILRFF